MTAVDSAARYRTDQAKNWVSFLVGEVRYAVEIHIVREIVNPLPVVSLPHAPGIEYVDVGTAAPDEADLLHIVAGSPLLVVRTTVRDSAGHPLVHSYSRLRPDVSQVEFEVSVGGR